MNSQKKVTIAIVLVLTLFTVMLATADANSLVGHWTMDDNAASTAVVDSAGSYHGTFLDSTNPNTSYHHSATRKEGTGSLSFDGDDDYVSMPRNSVLETGHAATHNPQKVQRSVK